MHIEDKHILFNYVELQNRIYHTIKDFLFDDETLNNIVLYFNQKDNRYSKIFRSFISRSKIFNY